MLFSQDPSTFPQQPGVTWAQTSYKDKAELVQLFKGADVVLNFISPTNDPGSEVSIRVIDAVVEAGVRRYAPSEWAMYVYGWNCVKMTRRGQKKKEKINRH